MNRAPASLQRRGLRGATKIKPAASQVKLPDGMLSSLYLSALLARLTAQPAAKGKKFREETKS